MADPTTLSPDNPFAEASPLPYQLPRFDAIAIADIEPAVRAGIAQQQQAISAVTADSRPADFANTIEAMERSDVLLRRVVAYLYNQVGSNSSTELREVYTALAPVLAAHSDAIYLDQALFSRVQAVYDAREDSGLTGEQIELVDRYHRTFVRAGAALSGGDQDQLREFNRQLSELTTDFSNRLLDESNDLAVHITDEADLDGLPEASVAAARQSAAARGLDGWLITLISPTRQPALNQLRNRAVRQRIHEASVSRGIRGNDSDVRDIVVQIVTTRAQRAALLGFADHAAYVIDDQTAGSVQRVSDLLADLVGPAVRNANTEAEEIAAALAADGVDGPVQPWDWAYYSEQVKARTYAIDAADLTPYFEFNRVLRDGVFYAASQLYGLTFTERTDLPTYHPDVLVFEVHDQNGEPLGLFLADWFARDSKRGGAWMSEYAGQSLLEDTRPVVIVNLNVPRPPDGQPALLTSDEVNTSFHEFGHALHGLLSQVTYPTIAGTSVPRDFVEFPSQVNEMWAWWPEVLANYAKHHETGEPLPQELADKLLASQSYGEGFRTVEYLAAALLDQEWHRLSATAVVDDVLEFEAAALERNGVDLTAVPPRYRTGYFQHIFASGYAAGYYSYIWSEVLDADMVDWFTENGGLRRENGDRFRDGLLSRGGSVDPMAAFEAVRGRAPDVEPLLKRRALV